jgi:hypothetical protein
MAGVLSRPLEGESFSSLEAVLLEHLQLVCTSKTFENSTTLKNLLVYLCEHRDDSINEYTIAVEALNRRPDFDPQIDATVRVQISRLRRRLKEFYLSEGSSTGIRFTIPLGTHRLALDGTSYGVSLPGNATVEHSPDLPPVKGGPKAPAFRFANSTLTLVLGCLVLALAVLCGWQYWQLKSQARAASPESLPQPVPFWKEFCANGKPLQIVIPNPIFFTWARPNGRGLMVRDTSVNNFMNIEGSPELAILQEKLGKPQLAQHYAVSSDVIASLKLMHYMDSRNIKIDIAISSDASAELFEGENVILVGTPGTLTPFQNQLDRLYFKFEPQGRRLYNPQPIAPEPREFAQIQESPSRNIYPGLIALLPGISRDSQLLILAGQRTAALVSYLTSTSGNQQLQEARNRAGGAPYFEAVILSEVEGGTVLNSHLAAIRAYRPKAAQN